MNFIFTQPYAQIILHIYVVENSLISVFGICCFDNMITWGAVCIQIEMYTCTKIY